MYAEDKSMFFAVHLELTEKSEVSIFNKQQLATAEEGIATYLLTVNRDYRESYENNKAALAPRIQLHPYGDALFSQNKTKLKHVYYTKPAKSIQ
ncbi:hypothetical protein COZ14_01710 [Candidatus Dojkabacteria bacterium CG_4_10_14_3_um_filter_Dojkabacteria_WS6_41_9]|nr:MAG: hypothetical protein COZ14_01710 [Candidatus Dojkabacteria bacterium CG_4_10_14_3_um_filter_Dojkabacteria_WS6_41_9]